MSASGWAGLRDGAGQACDTADFVASEPLEAAVGTLRQPVDLRRGQAEQGVADRLRQTPAPVQLGARRHAQLPGEAAVVGGVHGHMVDPAQVPGPEVQDGKAVGWIFGTRKRKEECGLRPRVAGLTPETVRDGRGRTEAHDLQSRSLRPKTLEFLRLLADLHRRLDANHRVTGSSLRFPVFSVRSWRIPWD